MALARSASGPGGLSINTGSANLFGSNTSQPPAAGGLFGSPTPKPAQSGSLFGTATSQPQAGTSLFGNTTATSQPQQSGALFAMQKPQSSTTGGLFGTAPTQQAQQTTGGGLFGGGATATQAKPPQVGGLFGGTATAQQPQQQQQTGGLFGTAAAQSQPAQGGGGVFGQSTQTQPAQGTGGGLFGQSAQTQPAQGAGGGLFGQSTQTRPAQGGGLFGQTAPYQQPLPATGGLFGASTANTGGSMFAQSMANTSQQQGGGLFGLGQNTNPAQQHAGFGQSTNNVGLTMGQSAAANQQSQMVPGVRIDVSNIRPTTRFNDLQEDLQRHIAAIDEGIQKCIRDKEAVDVFLPAHGEQLSAIPIDVNFVTRKSDGAQAATESDLTALGQLRDFVRTDADHARLSFKAVDNLRLPAQYHQAGLWSTRSQPTAGGTGTSDDSQSSGDLISFFSKTADEMEEMMKKFEKNLGEIEVHMTGVQSNLFEQLQRAQTQSKNGTQGAVDERLLELNMVLQEFEQSILQVAGVVGGIKEGVTQLQLKDFMGNGS